MIDLSKLDIKIEPFEEPTILSKGSFIFCNICKNTRNSYTSLYLRVKIFLINFLMEITCLKIITIIYKQVFLANNKIVNLVHVIIKNYEY